jgi:ribosomal protein S9
LVESDIIVDVDTEIGVFCSQVEYIRCSRSRSLCQLFDLAKRFTLVMELLRADFRQSNRELQNVEVVS